ncbi:hypothetical protein ACH4UR_35560 [Streptomyces lydicus]|uniref:hypothetical protein n=1 Tax=Streptomyces lydicus TaxID=47763 RepID=UPI0033E061CE
MGGRREGEPFGCAQCPCLLAGNCLAAAAVAGGGEVAGGPLPLLFLDSRDAPSEFVGVCVLHRLGELLDAHRVVCT